MSIPITALGYACASATSITIPGTYNNGDLIIIMAWNSGGATAPTAPAGWTSFGNSTLNSAGSNFCWKLAVSNADVSGTWTNATDIACAVYHNISSLTTPLTSSQGANNANSNAALLYNAVAPVKRDTSWIIAMAAIFSTNTSLATTLPTGLVNQATNTGSSSQIVVHDSNGILNYFQTATGGNLAANLTGTGGAWHTWVVEIRSEVSANHMYLRQGFQ